MNPLRPLLRPRRDADASVSARAPAGRKPDRNADRKADPNADPNADPKPDGISARRPDATFTQDTAPASEREPGRWMPPLSTLLPTVLLACSLAALALLWQWQAIASTWAAWILPVCASLGAGAAGVWALAASLQRRLATITRAVRRLEEGHAYERVACEGGGDVGRLAYRVNRMAAAAAKREDFNRQQALTDPLTGLPNRVLLADRLRQAVRASERSKAEVAVMVVDLDRFKFINDTLGHDLGDRVLKEVARRLTASARDSDTVARLGGDEFVLLLSGGEQAAQEVGTRVLQAMNEPLRHDTHVIDIGASIGIAIYPRHGGDEATLMRHADVAMYRAKRQQRGLVVFDGSDEQVRRSYLSMHGELRKALEAGEFELDYQPKLDLRSGLIVGVESLVRWNHRTRGRVPPGEFIPFAEQTGFIRELTRWVTAQSVRFAAELAQAGLDVRVSANISAQDIEGAGFCDEIASLLRRARLEPRRLCLEITESGLVTETPAALKALHDIAALGVRLSVDDFGTGYATLKQLQQLPVHEMKIDRSFVSGMTHNRGSESIVRATIDLGRQLGLCVVAEGVESVAEMRALAALGCSEIQGYFVAKPLREATVVDWIRSRHLLYESSPSAYFEMLTAQQGGAAGTRAALHS